MNWRERRESYFRPEFPRSTDQVSEKKEERERNNRSDNFSSRNFSSLLLKSFHSLLLETTDFKTSSFKLYLHCSSSFLTSCFGCGQNCILYLSSQERQRRIRSDCDTRRRKSRKRKKNGLSLKDGLLFLSTFSLLCHLCCRCILIILVNGILFVIFIPSHCQPESLQSIRGMQIRVQSRNVSTTRRSVLRGM